MDATESETKLTANSKEDLIDNDEQSSSKKNEVTPLPKKIVAVTEEYKPQTTMVHIASSGSFSAKTLPLPSRPLSTNSETAANECIYDQLPGSLNVKPPPGASNTMPKPQTNVVKPITEPTVEENELQPVTTKGEDETAGDDDNEEKVDLATERSNKDVEKTIEGQQKYDDINTHKVCTIVTMILCGLILNVFAFTCLIPAFLYSTKSKRKLVDDSDLEEAERYAKKSLILNLIAVIVTFIVIFAVFVIIQIVFGVSNMYK